MKAGIAAGFIALVAAPTCAFAAEFLPSHAVICLDDKGNRTTVVSKERLAKAILKSTDAWKLYIDVDHVNPKYAPKWRAIFMDLDFCATDKACLAPPAGAAADADPTPKPDRSVANETLRQLREKLHEAIYEGTTRGNLYSTTNPLMGTTYLASLGNDDPIHCLGDDPPPPPKPYVIKMPKDLRLRANSDDLSIDASKSKDAFKVAKPATISYTADSVLATRSTRLQAALGYAFRLPDGKLPKGFDYLKQEIIPFIAATQAMTKGNGKQATLADTNTVAVGALFASTSARVGWEGLTNVVSAKPQYVWNTKDKSEIASVTFVYQPWTTEGLTINTPNQIGKIGDASWLMLLFDLRNDAGTYVKRSTDPVAALTQSSFDRAGSKFGFAIYTNDQGPHVVLNVTETLLYGFAGGIRRLDYLDSSLTYYFDSTSNFGFTLSYSKGTNEDTAQRAQTYTAGLSAKF